MEYSLPEATIGVKWECVWNGIISVYLNMANEKHLEILKQGKDVWNKWMKVNWKDLPKIKAYNNIALRNTKISNLSLTVADLSGLDLTEYKDFIGYNFKRVKFNDCNLKGVLFENCEIMKTNLGQTSLYKASFINTQLIYSSLMWSKMIETNFDNSFLKKCRIYGASIWNVNVEDTEQIELIITKPKEIDITVDNLEIAQFLYLMINNKKIKSIIDTLTSKIVLILGRFSKNGKPILENIKISLREKGYVPVIFDFEKPLNKDYIEPIILISQMARFVIADFSNSKAILEEIPKIVDNSSVVIIPVLKKGQKVPSTLHNIRINRISILKPYIYPNTDKLLLKLISKLIPKAEKRLFKLQKRRNKYSFKKANTI